MTIFNLITLFGGLALFLYGMRLMGDGLNKMLLMLNATLKLLLELQISQQLLKIFWQSGILPGQILCAEFYTHWNYFFFQKCNLYKKFCS